MRALRDARILSQNPRMQYLIRNRDFADVSKNLLDFPGGPYLVTRVFRKDSRRACVERRCDDGHRGQRDLKIACGWL